MARGLMIRMESMGPDGKDAEESLAVNADAAAATEEVESASGDVTEIDTGIDNAMEAKDELGEVTDLVQESVDDGDGLSPREAAHVEARLEHIASLLGTTAKKQGLTFRRESFGGTSSRLAATKMRLEGLKEFGNSIWEAIKRGWEWLKDAVKNLWAKMTSNAEMLEKRFGDLQGRLDGLSGSLKLKNSKLSAGAKVFSIDNKTDFSTIESVMGLCDKSALFITAYLKETTKIVKEEDITSDGGQDIATKNVRRVIECVENICKSTAGAKVTTASLPKDVGKDSISYGNWPGNKTMVLEPLNKTIEGYDIISYKLLFGDANEKVADDYEAFDKAGLSKLLTIGKASAKNLIEFKKTLPEIEQGINLSINFCEERSKLKTSALSKADVTKKTKEDSLLVEKVKGEIANIVSGGARACITNVPKLFFQGVSALGDVINAGISNLEKEKK